MKKILLDTNIILDIALEQRDFFEKAKQIIETLYLKKSQIYVTASTVTDIYYLLKKKKGHLHTINFLKNLFIFVDIAGVNKKTIINALNSEMKDFEDAVQLETAKLNEIEIIITRNKNDFINSVLEIYNPDEYLNILKNNK